MRIYTLDLIRFFAALSVVLYHYTARLESIETFPVLSNLTQYGYLGVPLFFIISGFVISLSAHSRTPLEFAISRFVRLYPAYWVGVTFTSIFIIIFHKKLDITQYIVNLTMLNDYFGYKDIDGIYWTLHAELKFYACVFILLFFGIFDKFKIWLGLWLLITTLYLIFQQPYFMGWFISPTYSSFFIAGVGFYLVKTEGTNYFNVSVILTSLIISTIYGYEQADGFLYKPTHLNKLIVTGFIWSFYFIFLLLVLGKIKAQKNKLFLILGGMTYPLYLIHGVAGKAIIDKYKIHLNESILVLLTIIAMLTISFGIHYYFERKIATRLKKYLLSIFSPTIQK